MIDLKLTAADRMCGSKIALRPGDAERRAIELGMGWYECPECHWCHLTARHASWTKETKAARRKARQREQRRRHR